MGVEGGNGYPWSLKTKVPPETLIGNPYRLQNLLLRQELGNLFEWYMDGDQYDLESSASEHHRVIYRLRERCQKLGVAREGAPSPVDSLFAYRSRHHGIDFTCQRHTRRRFDIAYHSSAAPDVRPPRLNPFGMEIGEVMDSQLWNNGAEPQLAGNVSQDGLVTEDNGAAESCHPFGSDCF